MLRAPLRNAGSTFFSAWVRDGRGQIIAALNCGMPFRVEARAHALKKVLPVLRNGARSIERSLLTGAGGVAAAARG